MDNKPFQPKNIEIMFGLFKKDPIKQLEKEINRKLEQARDIQRSGDIKGFARIMGEVDELQKNLDSLRPPS